MPVSGYARDDGRRSFGRAGVAAGGCRPLGGRGECRRVLVVFAAVLAALLLSSASALAGVARPHVFDSSFGTVGAGAGQLSGPAGVAVSESSGDVYVVDRANNRVEQFSAEGEFVAAWGWGVVDGARKFEICTSACQAGIPGVGKGQLSSPEAIAVDNSPSPSDPSSGDIYVAADTAAEQTAIEKFNPSGEPIGPAKLKTEGKGSLDGVAVDSTGVLAAYWSTGEIERFSDALSNKLLPSAVKSAATCAGKPGFAVGQTGEPLYVGHERKSGSKCEPEHPVLARLNGAGTPESEELDGETTTAASVDPWSGGSGNVYLDNQTSVAEFSPTGTLIERFGVGQLKQGSGIAVSSKTGAVYVADSQENRVDVFQPEPLPLPASFEGQLPDGRRWELVSPPDKHGAAIDPIGGTVGSGPGAPTVQASEDGNALAYGSVGPVVKEPEGPRNPETAPLISTREPGHNEWSTQEIGTPNFSRAEGAASSVGEEYRLFSPDLSVGLLEPFSFQEDPLEEPPLSPENVTGEKTLYLRHNGVSPCKITETACYAPLVTAANDSGESEPGKKTQFGAQLRFELATPDLTHVVLHSKVALTQGSPSAGGLYEWEAGAPAGAPLKLISLLPNGEAEPAALPAGEPQEEESNGTRHAISKNGSRILWTGKQERETHGEGVEVTHLYMRNTAKESTIQIDAPQGVEEHIEAEALRYEDASSDGSRVFFADHDPLTTTSKQTPTHHGEEEHTNASDLYACEVTEVGGTDACTLSDLTVGHNAPSGEVLGVLGSSDDGSEVYFVANGALAPGASPGNCAGPGFAATSSGTCNLYFEHHNGEPGHEGWEQPRFIATVSQEDSPTWQPAEGGTGLEKHTSRVSPNGRYVAFMSDRSLTGYDTRDANPQAKGARDEEVYLYDAAEEHLVCASCNPDGERPLGVEDRNSDEGAGLAVDRPKIWQETPAEEEGGARTSFQAHRLAGSIPGWTPVGKDTFYQSRYLSDEGRLFFNSASDLVPAARNHEENVYEYEPPGVGGCASSPGCVAVISGGTSEHESFFLDASVGGNDVFFGTDEQLVAADQDAITDAYDAHVCTSASPCLTSSRHTQTQCEAEPSESSCRTSSAPPAPTFGPPLSAAVTPKTEVLTFGPTGGGGTSHHVETRAQKLKKALKACRTHFKNKKRRAKCERQARAKFGPHKKAKKKGKK